MEGLDLEGWPADQALALAGPPHRLRLPLTISNRSARAVAVAEASFIGVTLEGGEMSLRSDPLRIGLIAPANGSISASLRLRLDRSTPPGRYSGEVRFGTLIRTVEIDVASEASLELRPDPVVLDAAKGRTQPLDVVARNTGNTPLVLDLSGPCQLGRELTLGRGSKDAGAPVHEHLRFLDGLLEPRPLALEDAGHVDLAMPGGPVDLAPGASTVLAIEATLPPKMDPSGRYHLFAPLYTADLHIVIITSKKPAAAGAARPKPRRLEA